MAVTPTDDGFVLGPPHSDHDAWEAMLCDVFATSSPATAHYYLEQLAGMCRIRFVERMGHGVPCTIELLAALNIVAGVRPRDEAQAAVAVSIVSMHFMTMRLATDALSAIQVRHQDAALAAKLARTVAMQIDTLANLKGKRSEQRISVRQERHDHRHQHIHVNGGAAKSGDQPHGPNGTLVIDAGSDSDPSATVKPALRAALPRKRAKRTAVPVPGEEG